MQLGHIFNTCRISSQNWHNIMWCTNIQDENLYYREKEYFSFFKFTVEDRETNLDDSSHMPQEKPNKKCSVS